MRVEYSDIYKRFLMRSSPDMFEVLRVNVSPVRGCRPGSTDTSWLTSVSKLAVMSLISLWRIDGKPPREQEKACSTEKFAPHAQFVGVPGGGQP